MKEKTHLVRNRCLFSFVVILVYFLCHRIPLNGIDMSEYNEMLTVKDIKKYFHISINAAYNIIHSKGFPAIRIGNSIRVPRSMFIQWLKAQASYRP